MLLHGDKVDRPVVKSIPESIGNTRSNCVLVYGSNTKGVVVERFDCILVYGIEHYQGCMVLWRGLTVY